MVEQTGRADVRALSPMSGSPRVAAAGFVSVAKRPRTGFMAAASMAHAARRLSAPQARLSEDVVLESALREVELFRNTPPLVMVDEDEHRKDIPDDPLKWWASTTFLCWPR